MANGRKSPPWPRGLLIALGVSTLVTGCGSSAKPTEPSAVVAVSPTAQRFTISGTATASADAVANARVCVTAGANNGVSTTTDGSGAYSLSNLVAGPVTLQVTATGYPMKSVDITLTTNATVNISLGSALPSTSGRVIDADSGMPLQSVTIDGDGVMSTATTAAGTFTIVSTSGSTGLQQVTFSGPSVVRRQTRVNVPGADVSMSLIASGFDLQSFDQMFRTPMLVRWTAAPPLILEARTLQFVDANASSATATADVMTEAESSDLLGDLQQALPELTGGTFGAFASIRRQTSIEGSPVNLVNTGSITVVRMTGLTAATGFWGYGRYLVDDNGVVMGGIVMIDVDFDRSGNASRHSLRTHELGHALGLSHVTSRTSVMNPAANVDPTAWDLAAARIAFERLPGNRSPDTDPTPISLNFAASTGARWTSAIR
jgi:hypothetical protein